MEQSKKSDRTWVEALQTLTRIAKLRRLRVRVPAPQQFQLRSHIYNAGVREVH